MKKPRKGIITACILFLFLVIITVSYSGGGLPKEFPAPDFTATDLLADSEISLSGFRGEPVALYFFASW